jgi:DNA (cytosine-5)-methyltransferase 1
MNEPKKFRHGSLFSGIGGFDLAAEWMDWENVFHCEWNPFGQRVLKHYWPNAESFEDITKTDFTKYHGTIDLISGGFPCQPYSMAGKRLGKQDERHLWPHMLRAIGEIAPRFVVGENVRGITNWNGGMVFDEVCIDLENLGYSVAAYLIPASATNAPHKRERIWIVANANDKGLERRANNGGIEKVRTKSKQQFAGPVPSTWKNFPIESPVCSRNDGFSLKLDGITVSKWRNESIKAFGNAVCPNVVLQIFKTIEMYEQQQQQTKIKWP